MKLVIMSLRWYWILKSCATQTIQAYSENADVRARPSILVGPWQLISKQALNSIETQICGCHDSVSERVRAWRNFFADFPTCDDKRNCRYSRKPLPTPPAHPRNLLFYTHSSHSRTLRIHSYFSMISFQTQPILVDLHCSNAQQTITNNEPSGCWKSLNDPTRTCILFLILQNLFYFSDFFFFFFVLLKESYNRESISCCSSSNVRECIPRMHRSPEASANSLTANGVEPR